MPLFALDDQQLERLMAAASMLPPAKRDAFVRSVAGRVSGMTTIGMAEIEAAIQFVLNNYGIAGGADAFARNQRKDRANALFR
jgi:hypothetical protein